MSTVPKTEETPSTKPRQEIAVDDLILNANVALHLPKMEPGRYYPAKLKDYDDAQIKGVEWMQRAVWNGLSDRNMLLNAPNATLNLEAEKFKKAPPQTQYQVVKNLGYLLDTANPFADLKKLTEKLVLNGVLTRDQESELIQTHYYEQLFRSVKYSLPMLTCTKGTITGKSQTVRLLYQDEISFTYTTDSIKATITPGANISRNVGTYTYRDITMTSFALIAEVEDHLTRDSGYDIMGMEVDRLSHLAGFIPNYQLAQTWYDCEGADTVNLGDTGMTLAEFRTACENVAKLRYRANSAVLIYPAYWGLMADTAIGWASYAGRETPVNNGGTIPPLYGCQLTWCTGSNASYYASGADCASGVVCDNNYSGFLVQRYPPIIENFRLYERAANATSVQWMTAAGLLYANAICGIKG